MSITETYEQLSKGCGKLVDNEYIGNTEIEEYFCDNFHGLCSSCEASLFQFLKDCKEQLDWLEKELEQYGEDLDGENIGIYGDIKNKIEELKQILEKK